MRGEVLLGRRTFHEGERREAAPALGVGRREMEARELARMIDHTLLRPEATREDIERLCREAIEHRFKAVCVNPYYVPQARGLLAGTGIEVCTVIGFPLGATSARAKLAEAVAAVEAGATELDMVMNVGAFLSGEEAVVRDDIRGVVEAAEDVPVKVILETGFLSSEEISRACLLAAEAGAAFVKTSTGFGPRGASVEDVRIMKEAVGDRLGIKASGGIRDRETALTMIRAGATRIGTSSGVAIVAGEAGPVSDPEGA